MYYNIVVKERMNDDFGWVHEFERNNDISGFVNKESHVQLI